MMSSRTCRAHLESQDTVMIPKQTRTARFVSVLFLVIAGLAATASAAEQDSVTIQTVNATSNTVDVPVYIRDASGTALGRDQAAGSKIQAFTIKVVYAPASAVQSVTFTRAGITAGLSPAFESSPNPAGSITLLEQFDESSNLIPFNLNAPSPGDQVAHMVFTLSSSAAPGSSISLTIDPATELTNQGGTLSETASSLTFVHGAINIAPLSVAILPFDSSVAVGNTTTLLAQTSLKVVSDTTVTLSSSNPSIATVPPSAVIPAGSRSVEFNVSGVAVGSATLTAALPQAIGGATGTGTVSVTEQTVCTTPAAPQLNGPATAEAGKAYAMTWAVVSGATDYVIDESTDQNFATIASSQTVTTTNVSFTHTAANRYYYRLRARNLSSGCSVTSGFSQTVSVLVSVTLVPQTHYLPVVGSTPGSNGAYFKTAVQLFNPKTATISGKIVFHAQNASGTASDPSLVYSIAAGKTMLYPDLLPAMGVASGIGSADLIADAGSPFPVSLVRVFNDAGTLGTTGLAEEQMAASDALQSGDTAALLAPPDFQRFRLNIGVRTLDQGVTFTLTVRDKNGVIVKTTAPKHYDPNFFVQPGSAAMLEGYALTGEETISIAIVSGSAFIYGSTTDNTTQDPSVQFAKRIE
jgi:uncharacterized protein YjdB